MDEDLIVDGVEETKEGAGEEGQANPDLKYSDADIDKIVNEKFAKWQEKKDREISEAKKLAEMDAQQKAEFERDTLQKELEELREAKSRSEMLDTARTMLADKKLTVDTKILELLVVKDAEKTKENIEAYATSFKTAVDAAVLERIKNPNGNKKGTTSSPVTKDSIVAVTDVAQMKAKIKENMNLFQ